MGKIGAKSLDFIVGGSGEQTLTVVLIRRTTQLSQLWRVTSLLAQFSGLGEIELFSFSLIHWHSGPPLFVFLSRDDDTTGERAAQQVG